MTATLDGFTLGRTLGSGFSAKVKVGTSADGSDYALKIFQLDNPSFNDRAFKLLKEEVDATTQLDHQHVVKYFEFKENSTMVKKDGTPVQVAYIAQEMISGGELFDYVSYSGPFSEPIAKYYFKQMLLGVHYIHSKGFSHRDLKPENILLDKFYDVKIVDFGFACPLEGRDGSGANTSTIGTPGYMAPEILLHQPYQGQMVDLFALGVILFILYSGHPPFSMANDDDQYFKLLASNKSEMFWRAHSQRKEPGFYSEEFKDLITNMLQFYPHMRPNVVDIVGHPWIAQGGVATPEEVRSEFAERHRVNKERQQQQQEEKRAARAQANAGPRRDFKIGGNVYLSPDDELRSPEHDNMNVIRLNAKAYREDQSTTHAFFSHFKPDFLLGELISKLREENQVFEISNTNWKVTFNHQRQINVPEDGEEEVANPIFEQVKIAVEITKVPDQDKYCVDFQRKAGSAILYYDQATAYSSKLDLCNNATLEPEEDVGGAAQQ